MKLLTLLISLLLISCEVPEIPELEKGTTLPDSETLTNPEDTEVEKDFSYLMDRDREFYTVWCDGESTFTDISVKYVGHGANYIRFGAVGSVAGDVFTYHLDNGDLAREILVPMNETNQYTIDLAEGNYIQDLNISDTNGFRQLSFDWYRAEDGQFFSCTSHQP